MNYVLYDLEATCWLGRPPVGHNEIIEIGAFLVNGYGEVTKQFSRYIKPAINPVLSGFCKKLTSIQQHNVDTADKFDVVIEDFMEWFDYEHSEFYLISWGENDKKLLRQDCIYHDISTEWLENCVDLKNSYKKLRQMSKHVGLMNAILREELEFAGKHHRAIDDAANLTNLFQKHFDLWEL